MHTLLGLLKKRQRGSCRFLGRIRPVLGLPHVSYTSRIYVFLYILNAIIFNPIWVSNMIKIMTYKGKGVFFFFKVGTLAPSWGHCSTSFSIQSPVLLSHHSDFHIYVCSWGCPVNIFHRFLFNKVVYGESIFWAITVQYREWPIRAK